MNAFAKTATALFLASVLTGCCYSPGHYDPYTGMSYVGSLHFCHPNPAKAACRAEMRAQRQMGHDCGCHQHSCRNQQRKMNRCQRKMCRHGRKWDQCGACVSAFGPYPIDGLCHPCGICADCYGQPLGDPCCDPCGMSGGYMPAGYMPGEVFSGEMMDGGVISGDAVPGDLGAYFDGDYSGSYVSSTPPELQGGEMVYGGNFADSSMSFSGGPSMPGHCPDCQKSHSHSSVPYESSPSVPTPAPTPADPPASGPRHPMPLETTPNAAWHTPPKWVPSRF